MKLQKFDNWLQDIYVSKSGGKLAAGTRNSRITNCETVERYEGDLDLLFDRDRLNDLITRLSYTRYDKGSKAKHNIPINGDIYNGSATYKSAIHLYQQFREHLERSSDKLSPVHANVNNEQKAPKIVRRRGVQPAWPEWPQLNEAALVTLAEKLTPFIRFLNPDIIRSIADDNERHGQSWSNRLHARGINPNIYLWERSPCTFPGVRRYAGSKEIAQYRGHTNGQEVKISNALRLDDNDFPKHLWSFIFRGKAFQKVGPQGYSLAHLADHKDHNNRWADEFNLCEGAEPPKQLFGLYTSAANTVYVPASFLKPTDFNYTMRTMLQRKAHELYSGVCNLIPAFLNIRAAPSSEWEIERFTWGAPVGETTNIKEFLEYRTKVIEDLLA